MPLRRVLVSEDAVFLLGCPGALRVLQPRTLVRRTAFSAGCLEDTFSRVRLLLSVF